MEPKPTLSELLRGRLFECHQCPQKCRTQQELNEHKLSHRLSRRKPALMGFHTTLWRLLDA